MSLASLFGGVPSARILDFLRVHQHWDYSISALAKEAGLNYRTVQKVIPHLLSLNIIKHTRMLGRAKLYQFDAKSPLAQKLDALGLESDLDALAAGQHGRRQRLSVA